MCTEQPIVENLGLMPYGQALDLQLKYYNLLHDFKKNPEGEIPAEHILLVEHPHVYTLGKHGHQENMLVSMDYLRQRGIECVHIGRGGDITYHGPGQLVAYPILDLERHRLGVKSYIDILEEAVIRLIALYGVRGERVDGATGVWIGKRTPQERKICAIGVKCGRFVSMHGLALNVNTDLSYFGAINPCGFVDKGVTSLAKEIGKEVDMADVKSKFTEIILDLLSGRN